MRKSREMQVAQLADGRISDAVHLQTFAEIQHLKPCCRGNFVNQLFGPAEGWPTPRGYALSTWQHILLDWCRILDLILSIAALERKNKRVKTAITNSQLQHSVKIRWAVKFIEISSIPFSKYYLHVLNDTGAKTPNSGGCTLNF